MYMDLGCGTNQWSPTGLVGEQVWDAAQLLWYGAGPHHRARDLGVSVDHPAEDHLSQIQVDTQTGWNGDNNNLMNTISNNKINQVHKIQIQ